MTNSLRSLRWVALLAACFCTAPAAEAARGIELELVLEKAEYRPAEPIELQFKLVNAGKKPVYVNTRFKAGTPEADSTQRELLVEVQDGSGKPVPSKIRDYPAGFPKSEYFQLIHPGEEFLYEKKWDLREVFGLGQPGSYRVRATYQSVYGKELGLDVFKGPSRAEATFRIVEE